MTWEPVLLILAAAVPSVGIALLGYLRGREQDDVAEKSGLMSDTRADTVLLIDNLQKDNTGLRAETKYLAERLTTIAKELDVCRLEVARLLRRYEPTNGPAG